MSGSREVIGDVQGLVADVVKGTLNATGDVGAEVGSTAKGAIIGVIRGVGEVTTVTVEACSDTVRAAIKGTSEVGGDVALVTRNAVEGAIIATGSATIKYRAQRSTRHEGRSAEHAWWAAIWAQPPGRPLTGQSLAPMT